MSRHVSTGLLLLSLSACATSGPVADSFCAVARPIYFATSDVLSDRTERAVIAHNETGEKLCGWK